MSLSIELGILTPEIKISNPSLDKRADDMPTAPIRELIKLCREVKTTHPEIPYSLPEELAEHVIFSVYKEVKGMQNGSEPDEDFRQINNAFHNAQFDDVLTLGIDYYSRKNLQGNPSLIDKIFESTLKA